MSASSCSGFNNISSFAYKTSNSGLASSSSSCNGAIRTLFSDIILIFISLIVGGLLYILLVRFYSYEIPGRVALGIVGIFLIITGLLDYYYEKVKAKVVLSSDLSRFDWFILGFLQGIAVIPGLSRSGLLLAYLSFRKIKPDVAFKISLIVGAPILILAGLAGLYMCRNVIPTLDIAIAILLSYITSLLFGYLFYRAFMRLKVWSFAIIIGILLVVSMLISLL